MHLSRCKTETSLILASLSGKIKYWKWVFFDVKIQNYYWKTTKGLN